MLATTGHRLLLNLMRQVAHARVEHTVRGRGAPVAPPKASVVTSTTTSVADSMAGMPLPVSAPEAGRFSARP